MSEPTQTGCPRCRELEAEVVRLRALAERLERRLEELERAGKRQAAPFSKGEPDPDPKPPGRRPGRGYGRKGHRPPPPPERIDETHEAELPPECPDCGGRLRETRVVAQYQAELPSRPIYRQFNVHLGECVAPGCGRRVQGRHPLQTSDALGAAASQLGPTAQAAAVWLNKVAGVSHGKTADFFSKVLRIPLTGGAVNQIVLRAGRKCRGQYREIVSVVRDAPTVYADETGWRIGGRSAWLHGFVGNRATAYVIARRRGHSVARGVLRDYAGVLVHDGWAPYDRFRRAAHQQCLAHILSRCRGLEAGNPPDAVPFVRNIKALFRELIALGKRRDAERMSARKLEWAAGRLEMRLDELLAYHKTHPPNERLAAHLRKHFDDWFTFLRRPGVEPTNWPGEQAMRPAVVNRKVWGGNRTRRGAAAQAVLTSVLRTCRQRECDPVRHLVRTLCTPRDARPVRIPA